MMNKAERQQIIREILSTRRFEKMDCLSHELNVSIRTIKRDIEELSCSTPIFTTCGRNGGVRVIDGWYITRQYLHNDQEALLRKLMIGLNPDEQKVIQGILSTFAKPTV